MFKKFKKSVLTALVAAIALPLILALNLLLPKSNAITVRAEEALTVNVSTAEELSAQLSASDTVKVQLTSDISSETTFTVSGVKTLDLNGYVVAFTGQTGSVISVTEGADFTLKDGNPTKENTVGENTVHGGVITGGKAAQNGGGVYVNGSFTMEGGNVSGNLAKSNGGGVYVENGDLTMEGGSISGNIVYDIYPSGSPKSTYGGGVYVKNGDITMEGGSISGNVAQLGGGGVYFENGTFTMNDGNISGNKTTTNSGYGGGVYCYVGGEFKMNGGTIGGSADGEGNQADRGAGVYVEGVGSQIEINDSEISGNKSYSGGGIYVGGSATGTIRRSVISNNIAYGSNGGGVCVSGNLVTIEDTVISGCRGTAGGGVYVEMSHNVVMTRVTITDCASINRPGDDGTPEGGTAQNGSAIFSIGGNVTFTDGKITGNRNGAAVYWVGYDFIINGAPYIYGNEDGDLLLSGPAYTIGNLEEGAKIGVKGIPQTTDSIFTKGGNINETNVKYFFSNEQACVKVIGGEASVSDENHEFGEPVWTWADDYTSATAAFTCGKCHVVDTVTASGEAISSQIITPATCTSTGETAYTATVTFNGAPKTNTKNREVAATPHNYADGTKYNSDGAQHWKICKDCTAEDTANKENCSGGTATCTEQATCSVCNAKYGAALGHAYDKLVVTTQPTNKNYTESDKFNTAGMAVYVHCGVCGGNVTEITDYTIVYENGNELHYGDTKVTVQATVDGTLLECEVTGLTVGGVQTEEPKGTVFPWWGWLLIVLCLLVLIFLILLLILKRKSEKEEEKADEADEADEESK